MHSWVSGAAFFRLHVALPRDAPDPAASMALAYGLSIANRPVVDHISPRFGRRRLDDVVELIKGFAPFVTRLLQELFQSRSFF